MKEIMTLSEFLDYFGFDYVVYDSGLLGLVDNQEANLGNIEDERYKNDKQGVSDIIDRLDIYYKDYIFDDLEETLRKKHNIDTSEIQWRDLYNKVREINLDYDMDIMPFIFEDNDLVLDSDIKEKREEYLEEYKYGEV